MTLLGLNQMESRPLAKRIIAKVGRRGRTRTAVTGAAMVRPRRRGLGRRAGKRKSSQTMMTRPRTVKGVEAQVTTSRSPRKRNRPPRNERGNWMSQLPLAGTSTLLFKSSQILLHLRKIRIKDFCFCSSESEEDSDDSDGGKKKKKKKKKRRRIKGGDDSRSGH